ncbi:MAG: hypothetical protein AB8B82_06935 [Roseovarius sp.]
MKHLLTLFCATWLTFVLAIGAPADAQSSLRLSKKATETVSEINAILVQSALADLPANRRNELPLRFDRIMAQLIQMVDEETLKEAYDLEGQDAIAKLLVLAQDRKQLPDQHKDIHERYLKGLVGLQTQRPKAPPVLRKHQDKSFRLAWEYALLRPKPEGASPGHGARMQVALARIGDPASRKTAEIAFDAMTNLRVPVYRRLAERQSMVMRIMVMTPSEPSLRALADAVDRSEAQITQTGPLRRPLGFAPYAYALGLITNPYDRGRTPQWQALLPRLQKDGTKTYKMLIDDASTLLKEQK